MLADAPWWGGPLLAGFFALGGVGIGQWMSYSLSKTRYERERAERWHSDIREVAGRYITQCDEVNDAIFRLIHYSEIPDVWATAAAKVGKVRDLAVQIDLLCSKATASKASDLSVVTCDLGQNSDRWQRNQPIRAAARAAFILAVRDELGVEGADVPATTYDL